jgi:transcriptional regulator with XRE-family HTH domain
MAKSLGLLIRELREDAGISRAALARASNLTPPEVSRIELEGRINLRFVTVCRIAVALGISLDDLASRAGLLKMRDLPRKRAQATVASLFSKLDAVESVISRAAREIARVKNKLHPDKK